MDMRKPPLRDRDGDVIGPESIVLVLEAIVSKNGFIVGRWVTNPAVKINWLERPFQAIYYNVARLVQDMQWQRKLETRIVMGLKRIGRLCMNFGRKFLTSLKDQTTL